jgi:hypothetical protein
MSERRLNYGRWLWRIVSWDTLLPALISLAPAVIELVLPKPDAVIVAASVALPITAFFLRMRSGGRQIETNNCSEFTQQLQGVALIVGIVPLLALDALVIALPLNVLLDEWYFLVVLVAIYFAAMVIAMYPGAEFDPGLQSSDGKES